ncbi:hypothetical protein BP6252_11559 [Coleophoma cylindrospora]|uniref:Nuclear distribution protein RO10 n=1 Tax=Coleophoma cylindrospora TaxID=1849047 RepID=A0A3D8QJX4_9HELO|nr:hypothetical protein BP6252_11559 [Coleophoma cylindrospora]
MEREIDQTAVHTIELLEARLRRIEHAVIGGHGMEDGAGLKSTQAPATQRITDLERMLHELAAKSRVVQDLLSLHANHPDLFQSIGAAELPTTLDSSSLLSIVLASASAYPTTASRLTSISDLPIPAASLSAQLVELQPRVAKIEALQMDQAADMAELRMRTAAVLQRWYAVDVLGAGDSWAELEDRVDWVEQRVRQVALTKDIDKNMV